MTHEHAPPGAPGAESDAPGDDKPFRALRRSPNFRTSAPTNEAVKAAWLAARVSLGGQEVYIDAVILAAIRLVNPVALRREVVKIHSERFPEPRRRSR